MASLLSYNPRWLPKDLVAGLVLTALLVPQGMAYAELAGLPAITGLYTSILCLVGYALFGPSRILVLGPDSSLGPMIAATILPLVAAGGDPQRAVALASALALMTGAITVLAGVCRLGFVADLISKPTMIGYMNGLALTILVGQLPKLFGFSVDAEGFLGEVTGFVNGVATGETVPAALAIGAVRADPDRGVPASTPEGSRGAGRCRAVDHRGGAVRPRGARRLTRGRPAAGVPTAHHPGRRVLRPRTAAGRRAGHRAGLARRHDLDRHRVRGPHRPGGRRQPGDGRDRRGEHRGGPVPGVSGQHERFPNRSGAAGRRQDAGHRTGRSGRDHADPAAGPRDPAATCRSRPWPRW